MSLAKERKGSTSAEPEAKKPPTTVSRTMVNFWLDLTLLALFLSVLWCGFVIRFVFPPGTVADGWTLWGWTYDRWSDIHFALICLFAGAILLHVMLHWSWICGVLTSRLLRKKTGRKRQWSDGERTLYGVGLLVVIFNVLGLFFAIAYLMVRAP